MDQTSRRGRDSIEVVPLIAKYQLQFWLISFYEAINHRILILLYFDYAISLLDDIGNMHACDVTP